MIVFGVAATRNQLCPSRSIRLAPSSRLSAQAPRSLQPRPFMASRSPVSTVSNVSADGADRA